MPDGHDTLRGNIDINHSGGLAKRLDFECTICCVEVGHCACNVVCPAVVVEVLFVVPIWQMNTGCGKDLVPKALARRFEQILATPDPFTFWDSQRRP